MLSSLLPEWQLQFAQTLMLRSSQRFCALWWRQEETGTVDRLVSMMQPLMLVCEPIARGLVWRKIVSICAENACRLRQSDSGAIPASPPCQEKQKTL